MQTIFDVRSCGGPERFEIEVVKCLSDSRPAAATATGVPVRISVRVQIVGKVYNVTWHTFKT